MTECPICLSSLSNKRKLFKKIILNSPCCNQNIHNKCLLIWLKNNNTCPLCRESLEIVEIPNGSVKCIRIRKGLICKMIFMIIISILFICIISFTDYRIFVGALIAFILFLLVLFVLQIFVRTAESSCCDEPIEYYRIKRVIIHVP